jgi:thiol-disulfide isomerase/thioredoxin
MITILILFAGYFVIQWMPQFSAPPAPLLIPTVAPPTPAPMMTFVSPTLAPTDPSRELAPYPVYGPAAELRGDTWLNVDAPLRLADLRGKVVLLMFWAFECPPCMPVLENARGWHEDYGSDGLTVIGIHTPNIERERDYDLLVDALVRLDVPYPVAQDNDLLIWQSYGQEIWPSVYLIDRRGYLRYRQVGEGGYTEIEAAIQALLAEDD